MKNTFCLTRDRYAFLSHHIGDMENAEVYESFEQGVEHLSRLFRIQPEIIAYDMHPNYFTTAYAQRSTLSAQTSWQFSIITPTSLPAWQITDWRTAR